MAWVCAAKRIVGTVRKPSTTLQPDWYRNLIPRPRKRGKTATARSSALAQQYRRLGRFDDALKAVLHALVSPSFFGGVNDNLVTWFQRQDTQDTALNADPIWKHRRELCFSCGGRKENADYPILMQCIDEYERTGDGYKAVLLFQSYSFQMEGETVSFQEKYGFNRQWFKEEQDRLFRQHLGNSRDWTSVGKA